MRRRGKGLLDYILALRAAKKVVKGSVAILRAYRSAVRRYRIPAAFGSSTGRSSRHIAFRLRFPVSFGCPVYGRFHFFRLLLLIDLCA